MKFRDLVLIFPLAFAVVACGSSDGEETTQTNVPSSITSAVVPNAPVSTTPPADPVTGPTPAPTTAGCVTNANEPIYYASASGTGPKKDGTSYVTVSSFGGRAIHADQKLRVSIKPTGAGSNGSAGGSRQYSKMGLRVALVKNGVVLETKSLGLTPESNNLPKGIAAGTNSDPSLLDFSGSLQGDATGYSLRLYDVKTSYNCATYCTKSYYSCQDYNEGGGYWCTYYPNDYKWNYDYNRNAQTCCWKTMLDDCNRLQCGVGYVADTTTWSVEVRVETDSTPCITL